MKLRKLIALGAALAALAAAIPAVVAAHHEQEPAAYTGCLTSSGQLVAMKVGTTPKRACTSSETPVHLSSGDITSIQAGPGIRISSNPPLELFDASGTARIELADRSKLPADCAAEQLAVWSGTAWECRPAPPAAIEHFRTAGSGGSIVGNDWNTIGTAQVPAGSWSLFARVAVEDGNNDDRTYVDCRLDVTGKQYLDEVVVSNADGKANVDSYDDQLTLASFHTSSQPFNASVVCRDSYYGNSSGDTGMVWNSVRIHAVPVSGHVRVG